MKSTIVIAAAAASGLLIYALLKRKYNNPDLQLAYNKVNKHDKHKLTHAFAKAKKRATSEA